MRARQAVYRRFSFSPTTSSCSLNKSKTHTNAIFSSTWTYDVRRRNTIQTVDEATLRRNTVLSFAVEAGEMDGDAIRRSASVGNAIATWNGEVRTLRRTCGNAGPQARATVCVCVSIEYIRKISCSMWFALGHFSFLGNATLCVCVYDVRIQLQENCGSSCISIAFEIAHIYLQIIRRIRRWGANNIIRPFDRFVSIPVFPF